MTYKVITTSFNSTNCWPDGPKKSSTTTVTGTLSEAQAAINAISSSLSLTDGESIMITIRAES